MTTTSASKINVLKQRKILSYPENIGMSDKDAHGEDEQFMMFHINTDTQSTKLRDDGSAGAVVVAANTRQGIGVGAAPRGNVINKTDDRDMRIKYGDAAVDKTDWLVQKGKVRLDTVIVLPMPLEYSVRTSITYENQASTNLTRLGDLMNSSGSGALSDAVSLAKNKGIAGLMNIFSATSTTERALLAEDGLARNPKKEVMYDNFDFRSFQFSYRFAPRTPEESAMVSSIIETFRYYALPELTSGKMFYVLPAEFEIDIMLGQVNNPHIPKIATSVLRNVNVNYMPNNVWATLPNGAPLAVSMTLDFLEMELIDRSRVYTPVSESDRTRNNIVSGY